MGAQLFMGTATAVPQLSGFLHPTKGMQSQGDAEPARLVGGFGVVLQPTELPPLSPTGTPVGEEEPKGLGWEI